MNERNTTQKEHTCAEQQRIISIRLINFDQCCENYKFDQLSTALLIPLKI